MRKSMSDHCLLKYISALGAACLCKCLCWRKCSWCKVCCYSAVLAGAFIYHLPHHHHVGQSHAILASFLMWALKYPKMIMDLLVLTLCRASLVSSTNPRYSALELGTYTCIKHRKQSDNFNHNMHILSPCGIHSSTQLTNWGLTTLAWANFASSMSD